MYAVFDIETGGLNSRMHALLSVAVVLLDKNLDETDFYYSLVKEEGKAITPEATAINGITAEMVEQDGVLIDKVLDTIEDMLMWNIPVCHNAKFDIGWINVLRPYNFKSAIDTMMISRFISTSMSASLGAVCNRYKIPLTDAHNSLADTRATADVLRNFAVQEADGYWKLAGYNVLEPKEIRF